MPVSGQYIAFGAVADAIGKRLQQKKDQAHLEDLNHQNMVNQALSEGLKQGIFKDPQAVFETMINGGKPVKTGKDGQKPQSKIPGPLQSLISTIGKSGNQQPQSQPQSAPQLKTPDELNAENAKAVQTQAGAQTTGQLDARMNVAKRLIAGGMDSDTAYERAGLPSHMRPTAPKVVPGSIPSDDILKNDPNATMLDGSPVPPGANVQRVEVTKPDGSTSFQYILAPKGGAAGKDPQALTGQMKELVEAQKGLKSDDPDVRAAAKLVLGKARTSEDTAVARLAGIIEKQNAAQKASQGLGDDLPIVSMGPDNRPDAQAQAEFLDGLPSSVQAQVKGVADYTINPTTFSNRTTAAGGAGITRAQMIGLVKQYDPSYDEKEYASRAKLLSDWKSGKTRDALGAVNTAAQHLGELTRATQALAPFTSERLGHETINKAKYAMWSGDPKFQKALKDYKTARNAVAEELRRVYAGTSGGALEEVKSWQDSATEFGSTTEKKEFAQEATRLMIGRVNTAVRQYRSSMGGANPAYNMTLQHETIQELKGMGMDLSHLDPGIAPVDFDTLMGPPK